ncbi:MAG: ABC transporter ATP-binding protein [Bacteroidales bacterium]
MIVANNIVKSFDNLLVLKGVNLEIKESEVVSIVGASGAGKSTLLQILGSLSKPDSGSVKIGGQDLFSLSSNALADFRNSQIGFVFQFHHLLPEFTALENVAIPAMIAKRGFKAAKERATELLSHIGLSNRLHHKPSQLSGGEQQRVAIARALVNNPSVILADEPSGNLDSATKVEIHQLFNRIRDHFGVTVVVVTHDRELSSKSDRVMELGDGNFLL